ncbi:MAG TPA: hypothetical protein VFK05_27870 [Polyangiaceae bacterium]|nr:hypothetical protein [Polyangiaceae bacterium]
MQHNKMWGLGIVLCMFGAGLAQGCGSSDDGTQADKLGVAAECKSNDNCAKVMIDGVETQLVCLQQFKGGYCAIEDCASALDCPEGSTCVAHDDGNNYCFRICTDKSECNANRTADNAANCSSSFDYADPADDHGHKACIPPSSGTK